MTTDLTTAERLDRLEVDVQRLKRDPITAAENAAADLDTESALGQLRARCEDLLGTRQRYISIGVVYRMLGWTGAGDPIADRVADGHGDRSQAVTG